MAPADASSVERSLIRYSNISSKEEPHDIEYAVRAFSGATAVRVIAGGGTIVPEHSHDWPVLSLYLMGDYVKLSDRGEWRISSPSVVLHGPGEAHGSRLGGVGLEQLDIQFDPAWLGIKASRLASLRCWVGGEIANARSRLLALWLSPISSEDSLRRATLNFIEQAMSAHELRAPQWVALIDQRLDTRVAVTADELAGELDLHPTWLAQAYRAATGEGLREAAQRRRVEQATTLLRTTDEQPAGIAVDCGFCDQSHMNRAFRKLLGRTPGEVRAERSLLRRSASEASLHQ